MNPDITVPTATPAVGPTSVDPAGSPPFTCVSWLPLAQRWHNGSSLLAQWWVVRWANVSWLPVGQHQLTNRATPLAKRWANVSWSPVALCHILSLQNENKRALAVYFNSSFSLKPGIIYNFVFWKYGHFCPLHYFQSWSLCCTCGAGNAHSFQNTWLHSIWGVHDPFIIYTSIFQNLSV